VSRKGSTMKTVDMIAGDETGVAYFRVFGGGTTLETSEVSAYTRNENF
jgi:hypothetical protein